MIEHFFPNPVVLVRLHAGPLGAYIDAFAQELSERGYAVWTAQYAMRLLATSGTWLVHKDLAITDLDETRSEAFPLCRYRQFRPHRDDRGVLALVLAYLRKRGVVASAIKPRAANEGSPIRESFRRHLIGQRNLAPSTVRTYLDTVGRFLDWRFGAQLLEARRAPRSRRDRLHAGAGAPLERRPYPTDRFRAAGISPVSAPEWEHRQGSGPVCTGAGTSAAIWLAKVHARRGRRAFVAVHRSGSSARPARLRHCVAPGSSGPARRGGGRHAPGRPGLGRRGVGRPR